MLFCIVSNLSFFSPVHYTVNCIVKSLTANLIRLNSTQIAKSINVCPGHSDDPSGQGGADKATIENRFLRDFQFFVYYFPSAHLRADTAGPTRKPIRERPSAAPQWDPDCISRCRNVGLAASGQCAPAVLVIRAECESLSCTPCDHVTDDCPNFADS